MKLTMVSVYYRGRYKTVFVSHPTAVDGASRLTIGTFMRLFPELWHSPGRTWSY